MYNNLILIVNILYKSSNNMSGYLKIVNNISYDISGMFKLGSSTTGGTSTYQKNGTNIFPLSSYVTYNNHPLTL